MAVEVSLNPSANPPVTVQPPLHSVDRGNETIKWKAAAGQNFAFSSLSIANNPSCFSTPSVSDSEISVTDNNQNNGPDSVYYGYTIVVTANGQSYSSAGGGIQGQSVGPTIKNK